MSEDGVIFDMRVESGGLVLRSASAQDVEALMLVYSDDFDLNPEQRLARVSRDAVRDRMHLRVDTHQRPASADKWLLELVVEQEPGVVLGWTLLEAETFTSDRQVESNSWVRADLRGRGYGTAIRQAILRLAFEGLDAAEALSRAEPSNTASSRISEKCGYENTGWGSVTLSDGSRTSYSHWTLTRAKWKASAERADMQGVEPFKAWLATADGRESSAR
jgi:RimJ/RimL family protein N-acetyltransferase